MGFRCLDWLAAFNADYAGFGTFVGRMAPLMILIYVYLIQWRRYLWKAPRRWPDVAARPRTFIPGTRSKPCETKEI